MIGLPDVYEEESPAPNPATAANERGVAYYNNKDWDNAVASFEEALRYAPNDPVIQKNLSNARAMRARYLQDHQQEVERHLREQKLKDAGARVSRALDNLATQLNRTPTSTSASGLNFQGLHEGAAANPSPGFIDSSVVDLREATTLTVNPTVVQGSRPPPSGKEGLEFMALPPIDEERAAREDWVRANTDAETKADAAVLLSTFLAAEGNEEAARHYLEVALEFKPDDPKIRAALAQLAELRDAPNAPAPEGTGSANSRQRAPAPSRKAEVLLDALDYGHGDLDASIQYLKRAREAHPNDAAVRDALNFAEGMSVYYQPPSSQVPTASPPGVSGSSAVDLRHLSGEAAPTIHPQDVSGPSKQFEEPVRIKQPSLSHSDVPSPKVPSPPPEPPTLMDVVETMLYDQTVNPVTGKPAKGEGTLAPQVSPADRRAMWETGTTAQEKERSEQAMPNVRKAAERMRKEEQKQQARERQQAEAEKKRGQQLLDAQFEELLGPGPTDSTVQPPSKNRK